MADDLSIRRFDPGDGDRVRELHEDRRTAEVTRMRVDPDRQRQGYGTAILAALEDRATELGYETLVLDTLDRQTGAKRLYESFGYEETGRGRIGEYERVFYRKEL
ncbi:GNAT family N-acetyltransferase [Halostella litorea]|uniref:GNAT family N-acetyltransferase n=1 Tax=Halostella litorea TaxID=2528831 RepID=UPI001091FFF0|nr:GNAT family N-acetyltransferase [Halostella litorea]